MFGRNKKKVDSAEEKRTVVTVHTNNSVYAVTEENGMKYTYIKGQRRMILSYEEPKLGQRWSVTVYNPELNNEEGTLPPEQCTETWSTSPVQSIY